MKKVLKILALAAFLNGLSWIILIPVWQYPDEQSHFAQIQDIAELGYRPKGKTDTSQEISISEKILSTERDSFGNNKFTYHPKYNIQYSNTKFGPSESELVNLPGSSRTNLVKKEATFNPPLYYFLSSKFYKLFYNGSIIDRVFAIRFFSLILFLTTIYISYEIGKTIFDKKFVPIILASSVSFMPMFVFVSTGILPDPLTNLLFATILLFSLKILKHGISLKYLFLIFTTFILGIITRQQFIIALPIIATPIIYQLIKDRKKILQRILNIVPAVIAIFIGILFIPQLNYLKSLSAPEIGSPNFKLIFTKSFVDFTIWTFKKSISQTLPWYWGVYRWLSLTVPHINYQIINRILILSSLGILYRFFLIIKKRKIENFDITLIFLITASIIYFSTFLIWDYFFFINHNYSFGIQGRYFFPLIIFHLAIILIGLWQVSKLVLRKFAKFALPLFALLMIIFNNVSLFFVASSYYDATNIQTFINQASQYKPLVLKGAPMLVIPLLALITEALFIAILIKFIIISNEKR